MSKPEMTSMQRVMISLSHKEPDRVPFFLFPTLHGAKELGLSIKDYFSKAEYVAEGQLRLRKKYQHDCLQGFYYGAIEVEAWGGEVVFYDDGPPNAGEPIIKRWEDIEKLEPPIIRDAKSLKRVLNTIQLLKEQSMGEAPIFGVIMSPYSIPVMQMGFESYIELMYEAPRLLNHLMKVNETFAINWANAQIEAGATAIVYFDPVSSPTITHRDLYIKSGYAVAKRVISQIQGAAAMHFASGRCLSIIDEVIQTGAVGIGVSTVEDLADVKAACYGRLAIIGNLNGIEMRRWTAVDAEIKVKEAILKAGRGGGFILADNHGEIPYQVADDVLRAISQTVFKWGTYPLEWVNN
jgi:uroporphyrinogen decarboxylase